MKKDELFQAGKIVRTFGSKGELVVQFDDVSPEIYNKLESVFIKINENLVPFFIESTQIRVKNQAIVKFLDVTSSEEIASLLGCSIYLQASILPKSRGHKSYEFDISGFSVHDTHHGDIGKITSILDLPQHSLLVIDFEGKEILIPIAEEIIIKIDKKNKVVYTDTPEGLVELYL